MTPEQAQVAGAYPATADPPEQSGFWGGRDRRERLRHPIADAVPGSGSSVDIGCANGVLLEDLVAWCGQRGVRLDPWGLHVSADLVELARRRHPGWADRIFVGDVATWPPPRRWDVVRTERVHAGPAARPALLRRLLDGFLKPGGSLPVCRYRDRRSRTARPLDLELREELAGWGFWPVSVLAGMDDGEVGTAVAVLDAEGPDAPDSAQ